MRVHGDKFVTVLVEREEPCLAETPTVKHGVCAHGIHERDAGHTVVGVNLNHRRDETVREIPVRRGVHLTLQVREVNVAVHDPGALLSEPATGIGDHLG